MKKEKAFKRILAILLPIALVFCSLQVGGIDRVEAEEAMTKPLKASTLVETEDCDEYGYHYKKGEYLRLDWSFNYILELDEDIYVKYLECDGNLTIKGNKKLTINGLYDCLYVDGTLNISGATISVTDTSDYKNMSAIVAEKINLSGGSTIIKPEGGTVKEFSSSLMDVDVNNYSRETIVDSSGKPAKEVEIAVKKDTPEPEKAADETPIQEEEKTTDSGKKSYKNEWVNGQWYDANGKTSYKYKGGWKVNGTGWWYEDENGWFPTNMWQKIDGDWYFFHEDGYMAENEYAGKWELYSEGYWWVGSDGRWDGSEPGVWRLSGTKWWFKDSTGWFAKGKWYRIGGKWYEFDNDGWWIEPE